MTSEGPFTARMFEEEAPKTVANFTGLADGSKERTDPRTGRKTHDRYFDGTVFAPRIKAKALLSVAQMDTICPPSTIYGAYNVLGSTDKQINDYGFNDHEGGGIFQYQAQLDWLATRL